MVEDDLFLSMQSIGDTVFWGLHHAVIVYALVVAIFSHRHRLLHATHRRPALGITAALAGYTATWFMYLPIVQTDIAWCAKDNHETHWQTWLILTLTTYAYSACYVQAALCLFPALPSDLPMSTDAPPARRHGWAPDIKSVLAALLAAVVLAVLIFSVLCDVRENVTILLSLPIMMATMLRVLLVCGTRYGSVSRPDTQHLVREMRALVVFTWLGFGGVLVVHGIAQWTDTIDPYYVVYAGRMVWLLLNIMVALLLVVWPYTTAIWDVVPHARLDPDEPHGWKAKLGALWHGTPQSERRLRYSMVEEEIINEHADTEEDEVENDHVEIPLMTITPKSKLSDYGSEGSDTQREESQTISPNESDATEGMHVNLKGFLADVLHDAAATRFLSSVDAYSRSPRPEILQALIEEFSEVPQDSLMWDVLCIDGQTNMFKTCSAENTDQIRKEMVFGVYDTVLDVLQNMITQQHRGYSA